MCLAVNAARQKKVLSERKDRNDVSRWQTTNSTMNVLWKISTLVKVDQF